MTLAQSRILITGGSGDLGQWVVQFAHNSWDVTATYYAHSIEIPDVTWRQLDICDADAVTSLVTEIRPAAIIHTAAANPGINVDFANVNAGGTRHIARAAASVGARLVHLSTDVVLDGTQGNYGEDATPNPLTDYGRSKAQAETEIHATGAEAAIVRTSLIYGWQPQPTRQVRWILEALRDNASLRLFTDELRCPIWVQSLAAAVVELAGLRYTGVLNVAGAQVLSRYEFGVRLAQAFGFDPSPIVPALSRESGLIRPLDCTLDCSRARALLQTPLPGMDQVLSAHAPTLRNIVP